MNKNIKAIVAAVVLIIIILAGIRIFSPEDSWICQDGQWIKHGQPDQPAPTEGCDLEDKKNNNMEDKLIEVEILKPGDGAELQPGQVAIVHYAGWLEDGTKFDSSIVREQPFEFPFGAGYVIPGWDQGLIGMKINEKRKLVIRPELAYGENGIPGMIPANAILTFEVELLGVK